MASRGLIAAIDGELRNSLPGIRLRALEGYSGQVEEWLAAGRVEIAIYNRYRRGRVANADALARSRGAPDHRGGDHAMARRREVAVRSLAEIPLALPVRPNSLTSVLTGLAASQQFELDIRFEAGSTPMIKDVMLASGLATDLAARGVFARDRVGRTQRHSHRAAEDPADHLDVAEFASSAIGGSEHRRPPDPADGGA